MLRLHIWDESLFHEIHNEPEIRGVKMILEWLKNILEKRRVIRPWRHR